MFQVYTCLTVDHDWHLVVLAGAVCSWLALSLSACSTGLRQQVDVRNLFGWS